jgi:hypothetical protein
MNKQKNQQKMDSEGDATNIKCHLTKEDLANMDVDNIYDNIGSVTIRIDNYNDDDDYNNNNNNNNNNDNNNNEKNGNNDNNENNGNENDCDDDSANDIDYGSDADRF